MLLFNGSITSHASSVLITLKLKSRQWCAKCNFKDTCERYQTFLLTLIRMEKYRRVVAMRFPVFFFCYYWFHLQKKKKLYLIHVACSTASAFVIPTANSIQEVLFLFTKQWRDVSWAWDVQHYKKFYSYPVNYSLIRIICFVVGTCSCLRHHLGFTFENHFEHCETVATATCMKLYMIFGKWVSSGTQTFITYFILCLQTFLFDSCLFLYLIANSNRVLC